MLVANPNQERGVLQQAGHLGERRPIDHRLNEGITGLAQFAGIDATEGPLLDQFLVAECSRLDAGDSSEALLGLLPVAANGDGAASDAAKEA